MSESRTSEAHAPGAHAPGRRGVPLLGLIIGVGYLVIGVARDNIAQGVAGLAIMVVYVGVLQVWRRRSETAELLAGRATDERQVQVMQRASAVTGQVLTVVLLAAFLVSLAVGSRYTLLLSSLAGAGGVTFMAATAWFSRRS